LRGDNGTWDWSTAPHPAPPPLTQSDRPLARSAASCETSTCRVRIA
jgi:hypothetical protein